MTFNHDSLYAVGGLLTMESKGKLKPVYDIRDSLAKIDNSFKVVTDSIAPNGDSVKAKTILIDKDPTNALFLDSLYYDIIKAIAWVEYAGSNDTRHCHEQRAGGTYYNLPYNNYWDDLINSQGDTCHDTKMPCENIGSTATGTMQMLRGVWANAFQSPNYIPRGYYPVRWDSLAWSWKVNIFNGKYIYFIDNFYRINRDNEQRNWDSLCTGCIASDSLPKNPNKEDLSTFGYKWGAPAMDTVTALNWKTVMKSAIGKYVRDVRGSKYARPWEN